jgi:biopolymer transport protein TolR
MQVMGTIVAGGFTKVALLAQQPNGAPMPTGSAPATTTPTNAAPAPAASAP